MPRVTLKDIAKILGLSPATVSKALKNYPDINDATKIRVLEAANSLDYKPNSFTQSLRNNESKTIGLLVPDLVHHFFSSIINGVISAAEKQGYLVIVLQSYECYEDELKQLKHLVGKSIDGILLSLSDSTVKYDHVKQIIANGTPVVLFDKISNLIQCSKVIIDDRKAGFDATDYLIRSGCKKIAHVRGTLKPKTTIDRFMGYKKALLENNFEFKKSLVYECDQLSYEDGYHITEKILRDHPDVDGVFAFIDPVAAGILNKLNEKNIKVPRQVSVVGFSDWFMAKTTNPPLTTIRQPGYDMGATAFNLLYDEIQLLKNSKEVVHKTIKIPTELVIRQSTNKAHLPLEAML